MTSMSDICLQAVNKRKTFCGSFGNSFEIWDWLYHSGWISTKSNADRLQSPILCSQTFQAIKKRSNICSEEISNFNSCIQQLFNQLQMFVLSTLLNKWMKSNNLVSHLIKIRNLHAKMAMPTNLLFFKS